MQKINPLFKKVKKMKERNGKNFPKTLTISGKLFGTITSDPGFDLIGTVRQLTPLIGQYNEKFEDSGAHMKIYTLRYAHFTMKHAPESCHVNLAHLFHIN